MEEFPISGMSHWNTLSSDEIIAEWKDFREQLSSDTVIEEMAIYFFDVPHGPRCVDYYSPVTWLSPWEILYHKAFCRSNTALLMYYTLVFAEFPDHEVELVLINDFMDTYLALLINNQYILNYELGKVSLFAEVEQDINIIEVFDNERVNQYE